MGKHTGYLWILFCAFCVPAAVGQTKSAVPADSAAADTARQARRDSLAKSPDTARTVQSPSGIDSVVTYAATDSIIYSLSDKTMYLFGKGNIKYKELGLKAEKIDINWNTSLLFAQGVPDTADTTGKKYRGLPDLIDGNETYHGSTVAYNFKSKKGKIDLGKTEIEKGLYYGEEIKKVDTDVLFVGDGKFTTCDLEHPHYYFGSPEMKVLVKDKVIARPVYLYIADVPVLALPFGVFPSERGRRSGLIPPAYGESDRGRYLTHLGYYWAMNDYMDWNVRADGYTKGSYTLYSDFRYALRYNFSGGISGSYGRAVSGEYGDPAYNDSRVFNLHVGHSQDFNPTTRLFVDLTFSSGSYYQQTSNNLADLLRQNIISNATLSKSWEGTTPSSMSVNFHRDQNLNAQPGAVEVSEILPSISFNRTQAYPFRSDKRTTASGDMAWYELIGYTYGGQFENIRTVTKLADGSSIDERRGFQHRIALNASPKVGYFTLTPFANYTELWYDKYITRGLNGADSVVTVDNRAITPVRYYNLGVSASTKFFGIFQPGIFGIKAIRHQVIPSLSYTYQPDFSKGRYGYYGSYTDTTGVVQKYSHYEREIFGGPPAYESQLLSLNVQNVFEMKTVSTDTSGQDNKFQLLNLGLGVSYNLAADSLRFSEVGMSFRTSIGQIFSIGGSGSFNLYQFQVDPNNPQIGRRVNKFLLSDGKLAQLTSFGISVSTSLRGEKKKTTAGPIRNEADSLGQRQRKAYVGLYDQETPDFSIPWNLDLTWSFNQSQQDPRVKFRGSSLSASLGFNLTEFWKITATTNYDLINRQFAAPQITVYRDLHCWELNFSWSPIGPYRYYRFEIRLKEPQLQDVKITKQSSFRNVY